MSTLSKSPQDYVVQSLVEESARLRQKWIELKEENPRLRARDAASQLGVSEGQLIATGMGDGVTRLSCTGKELCEALSGFGNLMALTRNDHAVHEKFGPYKGFADFHGMAQFVGKDIDLRIFLSHWIHILAVEEEPTKEDTAPRRSIQVYDLDGSAVHKIFLQEDSNDKAFEEFLAVNTAPDQTPYLAVEPLKPDAPEQPDATIDAAGFREAWLALEDTHQFFGLLRKFGVTRTQALRLAPEGYATQVKPDAVRKVITHCAESGLDFMCFVGNPGVIQIHTGPAKNLKAFGEWFNILDPEFDLHLRETGIDSSWVVRKPTKDGDVTSLEIYDDKGNNIALFFGKRKPGQPEAEAWREAMSSSTEVV